MNKGENVTVEVIGKICKALNCTADDIMEFIDEQFKDRFIGHIVC